MCDYRDDAAGGPMPLQDFGHAIVNLRCMTAHIVEPAIIYLLEHFRSQVEMFPDE